MFTGQYAELYDLFHAGKNYRKEVLEITNVLGLGDVDGLSGFDFGCGTGMHAFEFQNYGARVDGYDISEDMLGVARKRNPEIRFSSNLADFNESYDFTYSLFDVISYQITTEAARDLVANLFSKTKPGGLCLVDSWNSYGVKLDPPRINERVVNSSFGEIMRRVTPDLSQSNANMYNLRIDLLKRETSETIRTEMHLLRAWSPEELLEIMSAAGFEELSIYSPSNPQMKFEVTNWRFGVRAKKP